MMTITEEMLKHDIELAKNIGQLAESVNQAISILATAILELENPEGVHPRWALRTTTRRALQTLASKEGGTV